MEFAQVFSCLKIDPFSENHLFGYFCASEFPLRDTTTKIMWKRYISFLLLRRKVFIICCVFVLLVFFLFLWLTSFLLEIEKICTCFLLSTSIYDLVLLDVCHFHHHHVTHTFLSNHRDSSVFSHLSRYSCLYLGSLHPRISLFRVLSNLQKLWWV